MRPTENASPIGGIVAKRMNIEVSMPRRTLTSTTNVDSMLRLIRRDG